MSKPVVKERPMTLDDICRKAVEMFGCDEARVSSPMDKHFLIIGTQLNTHDNPRAEWRDENGNVKHFDYLDEKCIASGRTPEELLESMEYYKKLCDLPKENWLGPYLKLARPSHA